MHSKDKKILNLINSKDKENFILGILTLKTIINTENVVYWYITIKNTLANNTDLDDLDETYVLSDIFFKLLSIKKSENPLQSLKLLYAHLTKNKIDAKSADAFINLNNMLLRSQFRIKKEEDE